MTHDPLCEWDETGACLCSIITKAREDEAPQQYERGWKSGHAAGRKEGVA